MKKVSKDQFWEVLTCCRKIGCIVDVNIGTGKGRLISEDELFARTQECVEIQLHEADYFRTYDILYQMNPERRMVRVVMEE